MKTLKSPILRHIIHQAKPYKNWFFFSFVLAFIISALGPVRPYLIQTIIDKDIRGGLREDLFNHSLFLFALLSIESILRFSFVFSTSYFSQNIVHDLRKRVFNHLMKLHVRYFDTTPIGRLTTRTINDVETINDVYSDNFFTIVSDILTIVFVLGIMLYTDVKLTLISLTTLPFLYIATYIFKEKTKITNQKIRDKVGDINSFTQEHLMGFKILKSFVAQKKEYNKFEFLNKEYMNLNIKTVWYFSWFFPVLETLIAISIGLVVSYVAFYGFQKENISIGIITSFLLYLNMLFRPMRFFADKFNQIQMGFVASERVFNLLDIDSDETNSGQKLVTHLNGHIQMKNVQFGYTDDVMVLHNLSLDIPENTSLAIVGATGSGKTSIINILNRFYPIQSGSIEIDGQNILDYDINALRSQIGMVLQDVYLFSGSILENICLENRAITKDQIISMAKELDIHDFFMSLPGDYNYMVKERGEGLSHGQRQIISLFRAIVKEPAILVLDEATSSIDTSTEYYIQKLISKIIKRKTSIVIAHRLSTIMESDRIVVLNKGEIVGSGTHSELYKTNTYYQKYFEVIQESNS